MRRTAAPTNWQARAQEFSVGQAVRLVNGGPADEGRVVAVWPGIGMVDIQFPNASARFPVEDVQRKNPEFDPFVTPKHEDVPGGAGSAALVPEGSPEAVDKVTKVVSKVASAYLKRALYWAEAGRKYRCTRSEYDSGQYICPRCDDGILRPTVYKRMDNKSVRLMGCPNCLFLIRVQDIVNDHCAPCEE